MKQPAANESEGHLVDPSRDYRHEMGRGRDLRRAGRYAEAAEVFLAAARIAQQSQHERDALFQRATSLREAGEPEATSEAYLMLLHKHPSDALGWALYGTFLKNGSRYQEAVEAFRRSLEIGEDLPTRNALVVALYLADRKDEAVAEGLRCLQLKDAYALARFDTSIKLRVPAGGDRPFDPRARHKNVIAFSLWGNDPVYVHGAIVNARIAPHIYYGWTPRFYCDGSVPADALAELRKAGAQVVHVEDPELQKARYMWRFLVSDDPSVDWFVCRDTDSRLNCQELIAVEEWLKSGQPFHVMRDHIYHIDLILAGLWGGRAGVLPNMKDSLLSSPEYFSNRFGDQQFLMERIWPLIRDHVFMHDTYYGFLNGRQFSSAYRLPHPVHVGGSVKQMGDWK